MTKVIIIGEGKAADRFRKYAKENLAALIMALDSADEIEKKIRKDEKNLIVEARRMIKEPFIPGDRYKTKTPNHRRRRKGWE